MPRDDRSPPAVHLYEADGSGYCAACGLPYKNARHNLDEGVEPHQPGQVPSPAQQAAARVMAPDRPLQDVLEEAVGAPGARREVLQVLAGAGGRGMTDTELAVALHDRFTAGWVQACRVSLVAAGLAGALLDGSGRAVLRKGHHVWALSEAGWAASLMVGPLPLAP